MNTIRKEVEASLATFKPSKAVYRLTTSYYGDITFNKMHQPTSESSDFITKLIMSGRISSMEEYLDKSTGRHTLKLNNADRICGHLAYEIIRFFPSFINKYSGHKNTKLTLLYRWYNSALHTELFKQHPNLENDLWNIYKWLSTDTITASTAENGVKLLDLVRQRYEAKGIKL